MTRPHPLGDIREHLMLLRTMAAETGADMEAAFDEGRIDNQDWVDAVGRCRDCRWVDGCHRWLDTPSDHPRDAPPECPNAKMLESIKASY
ncbi:MAG: DUF6455 family protein [Pseudomonadota bacterium]